MARILPEKRGRTLLALLLALVLLIPAGAALGGLLSSPAAAAPAVAPSIPASGDITLPACNGTTSTYRGVLNTPGDIVLRGEAAEDLRAGLAVFLFDAKGQIVVQPDGSYEGVGARLAYCGAQLNPDTGSVTVDWRFCTDEGLTGCAAQPPESVEGNTKLSEEQEEAIAVLLHEGDTSSKRSRTLLQLQVWCVTEYGTTYDGVTIQPGNVERRAQDYFNNNLFAGGNSPENARINDAEATCEEWAVAPDSPTLEVTSLNSPLTAGEVARFSVLPNFTGDVRLSASRGLAVALCPGNQNHVQLRGSILDFSQPRAALICITSDLGGDITLSAFGDDIPVSGGLTYLWNGNPGCQVFADYALGRTESTSDRARAAVRVPAPGLELGKTSVPASGSDVNPGTVIGYTLTASNTGEVLLEDVLLSDNLRGLNEFVEYNNDAAATINGQDPAGELDMDFAAGTATWTGTLAPGETVTITYSVTVADNAVGQLLENRVSGSAHPPGYPPLNPPDQETEHPVPTPGFSLSKVSNPPEYTTVSPGDEIAYLVTGVNTGQTVLDPVVITDDLSDVLPHATFIEGSATARIDGRPAADPELRGTQLVWEGVLEAGETVVIGYSVRVKPEAAGVTIRNVVTGQGTPPGGDPIIPPETDTEHPVPTPGFVTTKVADPGSGDTVNPGDVIVYTVTGENTGETLLDPVKLTDDLTGLNGLARYNGDAFATINGVDPAGTFGFDFAAGEASWSGALAEGETVTITYSVTVRDTAVGQTLRNRVTGEATPPGAPPIKPPPGDTEHPVPTPGFSTAKSADPASGTEVHPGDNIEYAVTGNNTGETVLDPVILTDDLGGVLDFARYNGDVFATINGTDPAGDIEIDADARIATWTGVLQPGETVTITYSVTVSAGAAGELLQNRLTGAATPPGGDPLIPPGTETEHPVPTPGFELIKGSAPASGSTVKPGDVITYTLTGENTGETVLDPVLISDDLSGVLPYATLVEDSPAARVDGEPVNDPELREELLVWEGSLESGQIVVIEYQVLVQASAVGHTLKNVVLGEATPPGGEPITPPESGTEHPGPPPVADPPVPETVVPPRPQPGLGETGLGGGWMAALPAALLAIALGYGLLRTARRRDEVSG
ncbi:DUF7927 domain-containing protein [Mycetocola spongiae]|uniref:DUF7927 domain-containing protein n=1 Tax=Mycetocola spongiae TaxID=2859226 RepID=UPI0021F46694|nr:hypothetical protein [Mycetocola spongiae]UCR89456.1 DUF11 domain-containing protein [Mycetocola spongiae]